MGERVIAHKIKTGRGPAKKSSNATSEVAKASPNCKSEDSRSEISKSPTTGNKDLKIPNGIPPQPQAPRSKGFVQTYKIKPARTAIPAAERRAAFAKSDCCQHRDKVTGEICGSRWQLQPDHIQPVWAGGSNKAENLQIMCAVHNRLKYRRQAGIRRSPRTTQQPQR